MLQEIQVPSPSRGRAYFYHHLHLTHREKHLARCTTPAPVEGLCAGLQAEPHAPTFHLLSGTADSSRLSGRGWNTCTVPLCRSSKLAALGRAGPLGTAHSAAVCCRTSGLSWLSLCLITTVLPHSILFAAVCSLYHYSIFSVSRHLWDTTPVFLMFIPPFTSQPLSFALLFLPLLLFASSPTAAASAAAFASSPYLSVLQRSQTRDSLHRLHFHFLALQTLQCCLHCRSGCISLSTATQKTATNTCTAFLCRLN